MEAGVKQGQKLPYNPGNEKKNETGSQTIIMQMGWLLSLVFKNVPEHKNQQSTISYFGLSTVGVFPVHLLTYSLHANNS